MDKQERTPSMNLACLRDHQAQLRHACPSTDLSEVSFHTEQTGFPDSRHSSLNTEPLTLDAEQIHDAKAVEPKRGDPPVETEEDILARQINDLVDKAQEVVEANERQAQATGKTLGTPSSSELDVGDIIPVSSGELKLNALSAPGLEVQETIPVEDVEKVSNLSVDPTVTTLSSLENPRGKE